MFRKGQKLSQKNLSVEAYIIIRITFVIEKVVQAASAVDVGPLLMGGKGVPPSCDVMIDVGEGFHFFS